MAIEGFLDEDAAYEVTPAAQQAADEPPASTSSRAAR